MGNWKTTKSKIRRRVFHTAYFLDCGCLFLSWPLFLCVELLLVGFCPSVNAFAIMAVAVSHRSRQPTNWSRQPSANQPSQQSSKPTRPFCQSYFSYLCFFVCRVQRVFLLSSPSASNHHRLLVCVCELVSPHAFFASKHFHEKQTLVYNKMLQK